MLTRIITKRDPEYPGLLQYCPRMPDRLYLRGQLPDPSRPAVAMVGARACSAYGKRQALHFAEVLAAHGVQIISGMAYGIDAWSHTGALNAGGATFAILGCGTDICYPAKNRSIYERILASESGGILSEFEDGTLPLAWHFPVRNRIISALADLVLVVEARSRSGSLITADYALEQGKNIYAVPGRLEDKCSSGCNELIAQGAGIATCPEILLEVLGIKEYVPASSETLQVPSSGLPACFQPDARDSLPSAKAETASELPSASVCPETCRTPAASEADTRDSPSVIAEGLSGSSSAAETPENVPVSSSAAVKASEKVPVDSPADTNSSLQKQRPCRQFRRGPEKEACSLPAGLSPEEENIFHLTRGEVCSLSDLLAKTGLPQERLCRLLLQMELKGQVEEIVSGFFSWRR